MPAWVGLFLVLTACALQEGQLQENVHVIKNNPGGTVIDYAMTSLHYQEEGSIVRFEGYCDSACTLLLGLPADKLCIYKGASFGFHRPYGASKQANKAAEEYLYSQYPDWVRRWISDQGGLQSRIKRMPFEEASAHIKRCGHNREPVTPSIEEWIKDDAMRYPGDA